MLINQQSKVSDDPEQLLLKKDSHKLRCPYVHKHRVQSRIFAAHIYKCRKSLPKNLLNKFATCKYNSLHIFSIYQIGAHQLTCPNRQSIIELQKQLLDRPKILQEQISQMSSQSSKKSKKSGKKADDCTYFNNLPQMGKQKARSEKQVKVAQIADKKIQEKWWQQNSNRKQVSKSQTSPYKSSSKFKLHLNKQIEEIEEIRSKWNYRYESCRPDHQKTENDQLKELELYECPGCCEILCNVQTKLWKNKKLVKLLKAYSKLQKQHSQIQQYIENISKIPKIERKIERREKQTDNVLIENNASGDSKESAGKKNICNTREQDIQLNKRSSTNVESQQKEEVRKIPNQKLGQKESISNDQNDQLQSKCKQKQRANGMLPKQNSQLRSNWVIIID